MRAQFGKDQQTTTLLANDTLARLPPLTFFRGLVVELDGAQTDKVDLNATALTPVADAARVFALATGSPFPANTIDRLQVATEAFPDGVRVFTDAAEAFRIALYCRCTTGGSVLVPSRLGKLDQRLLKTAFTSILRLIEYTDATFMPAV